MRDSIGSSSLASRRRGSTAVPCVRRAARHDRSMAERVASVIVRVATMIVESSLHLEPGNDVNATHRALVSVDGVTGVTAAAIIAKALREHRIAGGGDGASRARWSIDGKPWERERWTLVAGTH